VWGDILSQKFFFIFLAGLVFLSIGSGLFLTLPRILGKMIDEFDTSKPEDKKTEAEKGAKNELNLFSIIPQNDIKKKENEKEDDFLGRIARYLRHNPWAIGIILAIGACAIGGRIYLMHTTSLFLF